MEKERFLFLAKLGIVESTNELGGYSIQRIDNVEDFKESNHLDFTPKQLNNDFEAMEIFKENRNELDKLK